MRPLTACAIALCIALPLQAQTYKWVDEKGVTNYSTSPPPQKAKAKVIDDDQVSIVPTDPDLARQGEALRKREQRRADQAQAEAQRRRQQQQPSAQPAYTSATDEYYDDWWGGGYGWGYTPGNRPVRPTHPIANRPNRPITVPSPRVNSPRSTPPR